MDALARRDGAIITRRQRSASSAPPRQIILGTIQTISREFLNEEKYHFESLDSQSDLYLESFFLSCIDESTEEIWDLDRHILR